MRFKGLDLLLMVLFLFGLNQQAWSSGTDQFDHTHQAWTAILQKYVTKQGPASTFNYRTLKNNSRPLQEYLHTLESVSKDSFARFTDNEKLAFLINAYNAFTIKLILDHYPVKSIKDIGGFFSGPWKVVFFTLLGEKHHLDDVEHNMIRKWFKEPRIHFAVACASIGCPALRSEAFAASELSNQFEDSAIAFLSDKSRNRFNHSNKKLELSSIFKWYGDDFVKVYGSVENFVAIRITSNSVEQKMIKDKQVSISYLDYDWSLNEKK